MNKICLTTEVSGKEYRDLAGLKARSHECENLAAMLLLTQALQTSCTQKDKLILPRPQSMAAGGVKSFPNTSRSSRLGQGSL